jgi:hypothetical protein
MPGWRLHRVSCDKGVKPIISHYSKRYQVAHPTQQGTYGWWGM